MGKYSGAVEFISQPVCEKYTWQNKSMEAVACVYYKNMLRIQSLGRLPILLSGFAWQWATHEMIARNELQLAADDERLDPESQSFEIALWMLKEEVRKEHQRNWFAGSRVGLTKNGMAIGDDVLSMFDAFRNAELSEGLEAVLIGMVTGMWTSFEVMVEELWLAAIKERPSINENWTKDQRKESGTKSVKRVRKLYEFTFRQDAGDIHNTLGDERIEGLALVRNLLTHKLGKVDEEFDKRRGPAIPSLDCFSAVNLHQHIRLSGPIVQQLISPFPALGLDLISHIDKWITAHP